jgi:hypothetical protein
METRKLVALRHLPGDVIELDLHLVRLPGSSGFGVSRLSRMQRFCR